MERMWGAGRLIGMRRLGILTAAASIALIAACGNGNDETTAVPGDSGSNESAGQTALLVDNRWKLETVDTADGSFDAPPEATAYFQIDENGKVNGDTGCNAFGGSAAIKDDGTIIFEPLMATKMACTGKPGQVDNAILTTLRGKVTTEIADHTLTLTNAKGDALSFRMSDR
jgi:heat shock protein HslJ